MNMNKEMYEAPEVEVIHIESEEVCAFSSDPSEGSFAPRVTNE